ncbi:hypothetical protein ACH3XW_11815 [Acanthocheilonema viteae]
MRRFRILVELMVVTLMMLVPQNNSETIKHSYPIVVEGKVICHHNGAYAVLLNIFEEVKYIRYGNVVKGILRTSHYSLSRHDGTFTVKGTRYAMDHKIYLNITHHCINNDERNIYKNCFVQVKHEIKDDPRKVRYTLYGINLDESQYQSSNVTCVDWPYRYPEFNKIVHGDL